MCLGGGGFGSRRWKFLVGYFEYKMTLTPSACYVVAVQYMKCHGSSLILAIILNSKLSLIPGNVLYKSLRALSAKKNKNSSTRTMAEVSLPA